jgi:prevent-host-death family protein
MRVSSADFIKNYGALSDKAQSEPVTITRNGHDRLVLMSVEAFERLKRRDRVVLGLDEFTEAEVGAIAATEVPAGHDHLDAELDDDGH